MAVTNIEPERITGQVDFGSHTNLVVEQAVALVNELTPGEARGRPYTGPADPSAAVNGVLRLRERTDAELERLKELAVRLREVFEAAARSDQDTAAEKLNAMIERYEALPRLLRHDGEPWHLHFHRPDAPAEASWGGSMAVGLAFVLGSEHADRIGV